MLKTVIIGTPVVKGGPLPRLEQNFFRYQFSYVLILSSGKRREEKEKEKDKMGGMFIAVTWDTNCEILILLYGLV